MVEHNKEYRDSTGLLGLFVLLVVLVGMSLLPGVIGLVMLLGDFWQF